MLASRLWFILLAFELETSALNAAEKVRARGWLHLDGYTHHFAAQNTNDNIFGSGVTWYTQRWQRMSTAWEADAFQDSGRQLSTYMGRSWTWTFEHVNLGLTGALMYHRNFSAQNRWRVLPVGLPFVETEFRMLKLRIYYIPPVRNQCDHQVAFQLLTPIWR